MAAPAKVAPSLRREIERKWVHTDDTCEEIAAACGLSTTTVSRVAREHGWERLKARKYVRRASHYGRKPSVQGTKLVAKTKPNPVAVSYSAVEELRAELGITYQQAIYKLHQMSRNTGAAP